MNAELDGSGLIEIESGIIPDVPLVPIREVAQSEGIGLSTLWAWIKQGKLKAYKREGDHRTYVDLEQVRQLRGFREREKP